MTIHRIEVLRKEIREHEHRYYVLDAPVISDQQFDRLMDELRELEKLHPETITPDSPTQRVAGGIAEGFKTIKHAVPMLSLEKVNSEEELRAWCKNIEESLCLGRKYT